MFFHHSSSFLQRYVFFTLVLHYPATIPPLPQHFLHHHHPDLQSLSTVQNSTEMARSALPATSRRNSKGLVPVINEIKCLAPYSKDQGIVRRPRECSKVLSVFIYQQKYSSPEGHLPKAISMPPRALKQINALTELH